MVRAFIACASFPLMSLFPSFLICYLYVICTSGFYYISDGGGGKEPREEEALTLPESTHSFLFTEPVGSLPFAFGLGIAAMSCTCLGLALCNNIQTEVIPANVDVSVRIAQYLCELVLYVVEFMHSLHCSIAFMLSSYFGCCSNLDRSFDGRRYAHPQLCLSY